MPGRGPAQGPQSGGGLLVRLLEPGHERRGQGADPQTGEHSVDPGEYLCRGLGAVVGDAAQDAADLAHRRGRVDVVPDDVPYDQERGAVRLPERVVPVATHLLVERGGSVAD